MRNVPLDRVESESFSPLNQASRLVRAPDGLAKSGAIQLEWYAAYSRCKILSEAEMLA